MVNRGVETVECSLAGVVRYVGMGMGKGGGGGRDGEVGV